MVAVAVRVPWPGLAAEAATGVVRLLITSSGAKGIEATVLVLNPSRCMWVVAVTRNPAGVQIGSSVRVRPIARALPLASAPLVDPGVMRDLVILAHTARSTCARPICQRGCCCAIVSSATASTGETVSEGLLHEYELAV